MRVRSTEKFCLVILAMEMKCLKCSFGSILLHYNAVVLMEREGDGFLTKAAPQLHL